MSSCSQLDLSEYNTRHLEMKRPAQKSTGQFSLSVLWLDEGLSGPDSVFLGPEVRFSFGGPPSASQSLFHLYTTIQVTRKLCVRQGGAGKGEAHSSKCATNRLGIAT